MSTEEQREEISGKLSAASAWLEDEGFGATTVVSGFPGRGGWDGSPRFALYRQKVREGEESWSVRPGEGRGVGSRARPSSLQPPLPTPTLHLSDAEGDAD